MTHKPFLFSFLTAWDCKRDRFAESETSPRRIPILLKAVAYADTGARKVERRNGDPIRCLALSESRTCEWILFVSCRRDVIDVIELLIYSSDR